MVQKFGWWEKGYVRSEDEHMLTISSSQSHKGIPIRAAFEDVRLAPTASLLKELDSIHFFFPRSSFLVEEVKFDRQEFATEDEELGEVLLLPPIPDDIPKVVTASDDDASVQEIVSHDDTNASQEE